MTATPNFTGRHAVVLHRSGEDAGRLIRQLERLGLRVTLQWAPLAAAGLPDLVLVDADAGWAGLLPWDGGRNPVPLVALLGSEAPGRIAWALDQGADALIPKPVAAAAVYPALVMAMRRHADARTAAERLAELEERIRLRPLVLRAVELLRTLHACDEGAAYRRLQRRAMADGLALEQAAAALLAGRRSAAG